MKSNQNQFLKAEHIINLAQISSISVEKIKNGILEFRVNYITPINDKEFIDFVRKRIN